MRSDGLWRFACGDVFGWMSYYARALCPPLLSAPPKSEAQKAIAPAGGAWEETAGESSPTAKTPRRCMDRIFNHFSTHATHFKHNISTSNDILHKFIIREAFQKKRVAKLRTFFVPPLGTTHRTKSSVFLTLFKRPLEKCVKACLDKCVKIVRKSLGENVQFRQFWGEIWTTICDNSTLRRPCYVNLY